VKVAFAYEFEPAAETSVPQLNTAYPLVLDLDGTLLRTDLLLEAILQYLKREPLGVFLLFMWALRGVAHLKRQVAARTELAVDLLPINEPLAAYAREAAETGRPVIAATAANRHLAERVCARFGFISEVLASCDRVNLKGARKARALRAKFPGGYAYAGDAAADLPVWREAAFGIFAGKDRRLLDRLTDLTTLEADFSRTPPTARDWFRALRVHQWAKNALIFVPLMLAGHLRELSAWAACACAIAAQVHLSSWLAVFSMFLFLSLALAKRSTEIGRKSASESGVSHGRGYVAADAPLVAALGVSSAAAAVLLLVLYLIHEAFGAPIYGSPQLLWASPVFLGLWLGRVWLLCGRGLLHDDPVAFAVTDRASLWLGFGMLASFSSAALIA
jgi:phosphoserine phosphatase